jgi:hypothetical protein
MAALSQLLKASPACTQLCVDGLLPHHTALLLPALEGTSVSAVNLDQPEFTETQLALWCAGQAGHPVTLQVTDDGQLAGRLAHIQASLAAEGTDATLTVMGYLYDNDDEGGTESDWTVDDDDDDDGGAVDFDDEGAAW